MSDLIAAVADHLHDSGVSFALIGAAAMSARGFPRQTLDFDFLTTDRRVLDRAFWLPISQAAEVRAGDPDDPLAGVVRFHEPEIDIVVGGHKWQSDAVSRAEKLTIGGRKLPVVRLGDLMLLKLDAGGYRDAADVKMMLAGAGTDDIRHVDSIIPRLDQSAQRLWREIREV